jgi:hypothetical protein
MPSLGYLFSKIAPFSAVNPIDSILDERAFNRMLCLERRRSERSGNPFALLLVDIDGIAQDDKTKVSQIYNALQSETRDTDLSGWYCAPGKIGIIFTAIQNLDQNVIESTLCTKMKRALSSVLEPHELARLSQF